MKQMHLKIYNIFNFMFFTVQYLLGYLFLEKLKQNKILLSLVVNIAECIFVSHYFQCGIM